MQARCYQLLLSVFQHSVRALSTPYIHALAPALVEKLKAAERSRPSTPAELHALQEGVRVLEGLVGLGEEQNRESQPAPIHSDIHMYSRVQKFVHPFVLQRTCKIRIPPQKRKSLEKKKPEGF